MQTSLATHIKSLCCTADFLKWTFQYSRDRVRNIGVHGHPPVHRSLSAAYTMESLSTTFKDIHRNIKAFKIQVIKTLHFVS